MSINLNTSPVAVKLNKSELKEFFIYLQNCDKQGFTGQNYFRNNPEREHYMQWHLRELLTRVMNKLLSLHHAPDCKKINFKVNEVEQQTLCRMFQRVDCTPYFLQLQPRLTAGLTPINLRKW